MSENVYRINITCPRCQFVGDVEESFPCGHEALVAFVREVAEDRDDRASGGLKEKARAALKAAGVGT